LHPVKNKLLKIFAFLVLLALGSETLTSVSVTPQSSVYIEKDQHETEDAKKEQEDSKDKFSPFYTSQDMVTRSADYISRNVNCKYSVYLSIPELPPEIA